MGIANVISLLCGVALFLFGMSLMGDGLKKVAGNRLELLLYKLTSTAWKGILLGTGVTAVIQSSSATSVMVVGFVNSGMMKFHQAIGIILGAILGTSVTGWVIALSELGGGGGWLSLLSTSTLTGVMAITGIILRTFCKGQTKTNTGNILLGFSVLMVGMSEMSGSVAPLKESETFIRLLVAFSNPILGVLVGAVFTSLLQSASAAVGIVQALTATGAIDFETALPIIMGICIGAAVPVLLSALGADTDGKRTAFVYLLIACTGVVVVGGLFYLSNLVIPFPYMTMTMTAVSVALVNTVFRLLSVLLLYPLIGVMERIVCRLIPDETPEGEEKPERELVPLEDRFLPYPSLAVSQCQTAISDMAKTSLESVYAGFVALEAYSEENLKAVEALEHVTDRYEDHISTYLLRLTRREMGRAENNAVSRYLHTLSDFERIADHAMDIGYIAKDMHDKGITYTDECMKELSVLEQALSENMRITVLAFSESDSVLARRVEPLSDVIDGLCDTLRSHHVDRLRKGECTMEQGYDFSDLLTSCREISDHCTKVARAMLELEENSLNIHGNSLEAYKNRLREMEPVVAEYAKKYAV